MTKARDTERPLSLPRAARVVFDISLEEMMLSRRSLMAALLLVVPMAMGLVYRVVLWRSGALEAPPAFDIYNRLIALYDVRNVIPLVALLYATSLVPDEIERKTITYLFTRPVPRAAVLVGKFGAYLMTGLSLALPMTIACFLLFATAPGGPPMSEAAGDLLQDLAAIFLALLAYGSLFALLGVLLRRPLIPGLLYLFGWELLANLPGYTPRLTLTAYLRGFLRFRPAPETPFPVVIEVLPWGVCLAVILVTSAILLVLAIGIFSRREYVLDH